MPYYQLCLIITCLIVSDILTGVSSAESRDDKFEQSWQVIMMQGQRVGYTHSSQREKMVDGSKVLESDTLTHMLMVRFGQRLSIKQHQHLEETPEGKFLRFISVMENPPNSRVSTIGEVKGDELILTTNAGGTERTSTVTGMEGLVSPGWAERYLEEHGLEIGKQLEFETFEAQMGKKTKISLKRLPDKTTKVWNGESRKLRYVVMSQSVLPGVTMEMFLDENNDVVKVATPLLGMEMFAVTEEEALKQPDGEELDFAIETLVKVKGLKDPHAAEAITYHIQVDGSDPADLFVDDDSQDIKSIDEDEIELTVRSLDPSEGNPTGSTLDDDFLRSSRFLETDTDLVRKFADEGAGNATSPSEIAIALEKFVKDKVADKNFSTSMATALEVAQSCAGDCSEHAVLLAALLRVKQIPSRVVVGFVYSPRHAAFGGHMWTEAYLQGRWVPLDATLGRGGIGAGHIKVATSSLADEASMPAAEFVPLLHILGRTTIEVVSQN